MRSGALRRRDLLAVIALMAFLAVTVLDVVVHGFLETPTVMPEHADAVPRVRCYRCVRCWLSLPEPLDRLRFVEQGVAGVVFGRFYSAW